MSMEPAVPWAKVLELVGVQAPSALPGRTTCPLCTRAHLFVYEDTYWRTHWFYCRDCGRTGDMLELAAAKWQLSRSSAAQQLEPYVPVRHRAWAKIGSQWQLYDRWQATQAFQQVLRQSFSDHNTAAANLIHELGWQAHQPLELAQGPGQLYGCTTRTAVDRLAFPGTNPHNLERAFIGPGWQDLVCVPFYDLPGRLAGLLAIGRKARPEQDYVFVHLPYGGQSTKLAPPLDAGLHYHPSIFQHLSEFGNRVLAVRDPQLAMGLQLRNFEFSARPLPVVLWYTGLARHRNKVVSSRSWQQFFREKPVFWMPQATPCPATVAQAIRTNGQLVTTRPTPGTDWTSYFAARQPKTLVRNLLDAAQPWPAYLRELAEGPEEKVFEELLLQLESLGIPVRELAVRCGDQVVTRVQEVLCQTAAAVSTRYNGQTLFTNGDALYCGRKGRRPNIQPELVADAVLELDAVVHRPHAEAVWCLGRVRYQGESLPFQTDYRDLEAGALSGQRTFLLAHHKGLLRYDRRYDRGALHIFSQLHPYRFVTGLDAVGWNAEAKRFLFPRFAIDSRGEVHAHTSEQRLGRLPGQNCRPPRECTAQDLAPVVGLASPAVWAAVTAAAVSLVAPALDAPGVAVGLAGAGAESAGQAVLKALDSPSLVLAVPRDLPNVRDQVAIQRYPQLVRFDSTAAKSLRRKWLSDRPVPAGAFTLLSLKSLALKRLSPHWLLLEAGIPVRPDAVAIHAIQRLLVSYLQDLCQRRFRLSEGDLLPALRSDLGRFITQRAPAAAAGYQESYPLLQGLSATSAAEAFADFWAEAVFAGRVGYGTPTEATTDRPVLLHTAEELFIPCALLQRLTQFGEAPAPARETISQYLADAEALVGESEEGWVLSNPWWLERWKRYRALASGALRIS